jgi:hypothetical protein
MNRLRFLIAGLFAISLVTGILVGMGVSARAAKPKDRNTSWLAEELNLDPTQSEAMRMIWSDIRNQSSYERRMQIQKDRDDAIQALFTNEQKIAYEEIDKQYKESMAKLQHEREQAFQSAVESTKDILNEEQREKYDELIKRGFRGGRRERGEGWGRGPSSRRTYQFDFPATAPTTAPSTTLPSSTTQPIENPPPAARPG